MTDAEMILWSRLRRRQIDGFKIRRQHPIGPYTADFACAEAKLVIEVDGETHGSQQELAHDRRRTRFMESRGWRVIRCYNVEVYSNLDGVLIQIAEALAARTSSPRKRGRKPS
jgi:very-short-patch-repair endonuclease